MVVLVSGLFYSVASADLFGGSIPKIPPLAICGDGAVGGTEECDDGNTVDGDGCSSTCEIESSGGNLWNIGNISLVLDYPVPNYTNIINNLVTNDPAISITASGAGDIMGALGEIPFPDYTYMNEEGCTNEPCENPPLGDVIPNFTGLIVNGATEMYGPFVIDPNNDGNEDVRVLEGGDILLGNESGNGQYVKIWNSVLNMLNMKSDGLAIIDSPWIILDTAVLDIQSAANGGDLVVNVDGYLHANRIGSFYSKYTTYSTSNGSLSSGLNTLPTPECSRDDEYAISHWYNITGYNSSNMSGVSFLGVGRTYSDSVPKGFILRMLNNSTAVSSIKVGVTCFNANGYRPSSGETEV